MTHLNEPPTSSPGLALSGSDYLRQRVQPCISDPNYLHLKDLGQLLLRLAPQVQGDVFDYGCGGAPYKRLFTHCKSYVAADLQAGPAVDRLLLADGTTGEADSSYDAVLSTQVLEHLRQPEIYLNECRRILRPGGQLILTTHGMFEEHACPYDFRRWTSRGLEELVSNSGLKVVESCKLTAEMRAFVQLTNQMVLHFRCREKPLLHVALALARKAYCLAGMPLLNSLAGLFAHQAIVPGSSDSTLYVCIYVRALKS